MQGNCDSANTAVKKFSDFADEERAFTGEKVALEKILNAPIIVRGYRIKESKYKKSNAEKCVTVQFEYADDSGTPFVFFSGSNVLISQCEKYADMMPFEAVVRKVDRYYTFA